LIKLIQNELIKIFKRKSIYFMLFLSIIVIVVYNNLNPDQNEIIELFNSTEDISTIGMEQALETKTKEEYITQKVNIDSIKLYNEYKENSWQRYALKEERNSKYMQGVSIESNKDIDKLLTDINDFELNPNTKISKKDYDIAKIKYNEYIKTLNSDNWWDFVKLKIKNLREKKSTKNLTNKEVDAINFEIETYELRLKHNINFDYNMQNQYLDEYKIIIILFNHIKHMEKHKHLGIKV